MLYNSYKEHLISEYGHPVFRIGIDAGFSCPNRSGTRSGGCVFCDSLGASAAYARRQESGFTKKSAFTETPPQNDSLAASDCLEFRLSNIKKQIEEGRRFIKNRYKSENVSLYFQAYSNTYAPLEELKRIYDFALSQGDFTELIVSTRPDCINCGVLELLKSYEGKVAKVCIELGLQSGSDRILKMMNRGHDVSCYKNAVKLVHDYGLEVCTHVILGFPTETEEEMLKTVEILNEVKTDAVKFHNLHITSQSKLLGEFYDGEISTDSMQRHIERLVLCIGHLNPQTVIERLLCETPVHRLAAPRYFGDKMQLLTRLNAELEQSGISQGSLLTKN